MELYDDLYCKYYDLIHARKDYAKEIQVALDIYSRFGKRPINKVLDLGCGTGEHSFALAATGLEVAGVDLQSEMIRIAKEKLASKSTANVHFYEGNITDMKPGLFDFAVSLFYVVNHILTLKELIAFFSAVRECLHDGGLFHFDCWNGVAVLRSLPREEDLRKFTVNGHEVSLRMNTKTDIFSQEAHISQFVKIHKIDQASPVTFETTFTHVFWTPKVLKDSLNVAGFNVLAFNPILSPDKVAGPDDWKIMITCKKS